jgi:hypothetical protein
MIPHRLCSVYGPVFQVGLAEHPHVEFKRHRLTTLRPVIASLYLQRAHNLVRYLYTQKKHSADSKVQSENAAGRDY